MSNVMIPGAAATDGITLHKVKIAHEDGSVEEVYVQDKSGKQKFTWRDHVPIIYAGVATVVLLLTGYVTYLQIKKSD